MASLHDYGDLLLASRLRRVSETLYTGVDEIYAVHGVDLSSRCFPILFLLRDHGRLGISELALQLGQTHPAVSQMSRKLLNAEVVREWSDIKDSRRRLLSLSSKGWALMRRLGSVWQAIESAIEELNVQPLSLALKSIDQALSQRPFTQRIHAHLRRATASKVEIIPYQPRYRQDFKRLNLEWLKKYFSVEPIDEAVLSTPGTLLRQGGFIFFARLHGAIIGTGALLKKGPRRFELSKMAVTEDYQALGIGRRLVSAAIEKFESHGSGELYLETNSALKAAIKLYEAAGFVHATRPTGPVHYERSDVYMLYQGRPRAKSTST